MSNLIINSCDIIVIGIISSIIATIIALITRIAFYKVRNLFPSYSLFKGILGSEVQCLVFIVRLTDMNREGKFLTPLPKYAVASPQAEYDQRKLIPWVTSISETQSVANILNVLGRVGRTDNIQIVFVDEDFDRWDAPMFILGGSWKTDRSYETCMPIFSYHDGKIILESTQEIYRPKTDDHDLGFLQKTINPATGFPVWVAMGWRGAGVVGATYVLSRWWKEIGFLYGSRPFGILIGMNDRDGWQQSRIVRIYPEPMSHKKILHPIAWQKIKKNISDESVTKTNT